MKRPTYFVFPAITALSCMALSLIGDPRASFEGGTLAGIAAHAQKAPITPLSVNDVSWLFPAPKSFDDLISMDDLSANGDPIWSDNSFRQFISIANGPAGRVIGTDQRIDLPAAVRSKRAWYIAAVRFDPSAPGFSDQIRDQFGQELQIRLVVQPVTRNDDGTPKLHDIAGHLLFEFASGSNKSPVEEGCFPRPQPDRDLAVQIAKQLADVRDVAGANITTAKPLGIHPGLDPKNPETNPAARSKLRHAMKELLERHLSDRRLGFMTITAIKEENPKRWIFLPMVNLRVHPDIYPQPSETGFIPMPAPTLDGLQYAQMFTAGSPQNVVVPIPHSNNDSKDKSKHDVITCVNAANPVPGPPLDRRTGYMTADILNSRPFPDAGPLPKSALRKMFDVIANPDRSHVFNTDCISCHTETPLFRDSLGETTVPGIHPCALPGNNLYNMRAFGWAVETFNDPIVPPPPDFYRPTVSRRAANETAKVVDYVNRELLGTLPSAPINDVAVCSDDRVDR